MNNESAHNDVAKNREVMMLPVAEVIHGDNPREEIDEVSMGELMQSMKYSGLLSPIGVRKLANGKYKIVYGHRRHMAADRLGWKKIEAILLNITDEKDALLKTSTENVIRENVSLPENGRLYSELLKKGLTAEQIAIRMGCSKSFVMSALEAFNRIPKKFHDKISFGTRGVSDKQGMIPATVALAVVDIKKQNKLNDEQVGKLMKWASDKGINVVKMRTAGKMIADGEEPAKAMDKVEYMKTVSLQLTMKMATIQKLQTKYGMTIHDVLYKWLELNEEFGIIPARIDRVVKAPPELLKRAGKVKRRRNR